MIQRASRYFSDVVRQPRDELTRRQRQLRYLSDLAVHCWRVLRRHRAEGMAAELTYRTIFALIPLTVLGLVMFNIVGGMDEIRDRVEEQLYGFFGVPDVSYRTAENPLDEATERQAADSIRLALSNTIDKVASLDFASIGLVGLVLFIYAALGLTNAVEGIFNSIFEAQDWRPWHLRLAIHWSLITLGTSLLSISLYLSNEVVDYVAGTSVGAGWTASLSHLAAVLASWGMLFLFYYLMPNAKVSWRAAIVGALVAALMWETAKYGFQVYVRTALPYSALYGSLGLIPLFLFWVYVTWWIVLFGLVWTYALQTLHGRVPTKAEDEAVNVISGDPEWMLPIMVEIGRAFQVGGELNREQLVQLLGIPGRSIRDLSEVMIEGGLLRQSDIKSGGGLLPAMPLDKITVADVLQLNPYSRHGHKEGAIWDFMDKLAKTRLPLATQTTIADLVSQSSQPQPANQAKQPGVSNIGIKSKNKSKQPRRRDA
ncbi:ribonuclease BN/unknown domain fusion protein [Roseimaritima multifibrata]|uniref:Uncharacterized protein n=1 Tax=Roseimaritima multifibrata TaxID=1930274 RepID=A0A517ML63_9BACT|nr:YihY/virulence factor BrkB family protein [Roseimaritima multifibrata]QDS95635.1 ribonuclease BN/unknown domain fusion protein [Roseimaritima multifibrata]